MATEICSNSDLVYDVVECTGSTVEIDVYPETSNGSTLVINYWEDGEKKRAELPAGRKSTGS